MDLVNLTPHVLNIFSADGKTQLVTLPPSDSVARCSVESIQVGSANGVPLFAASFGEVSDLPDPKQDTIYVVSMLVRSALPERADLASPGELIRNEAGQPVGCKGLNVNR
jgi:hypothetical protein